MSCAGGSTNPAIKHQARRLNCAETRRPPRATAQRRRETPHNVDTRTVHQTLAYLLVRTARCSAGITDGEVAMVGADPRHRPLRSTRRHRPPGPRQRTPGSVRRRRWPTPQTHRLKTGTAPQHKPGLYPAASRHCQCPPKGAGYSTAAIEILTGDHRLERFGALPDDCPGAGGCGREGGAVSPRYSDTRVLPGVLDNDTFTGVATGSVARRFSDTLDTAARSWRARNPISSESRATLTR